MLGEKRETKHFAIDKENLDKQAEWNEIKWSGQETETKNSFMFLIRTVNATVIKIIIVFNDSVRFFVNFVNVRLMI